MAAAGPYVPVLRDGHVRGAACGRAPGAVCYGPVLNAAAVLLSCYGNVPPERAAQVMGMLLGVPVSAGRVDKAAARVSAQLGKAGFGGAMIAALTTEDVLAAAETPVNVLDKTAPEPAAPEEGKEDTDPEGKEGKAASGAPHVLITRAPDGRLTFLQAIGSRRKGAIAAGVSDRPAVQFSLHTPYREVGRIGMRPLHGTGIHRRVFGHYIPSLTDTLPPFPMRTGFPRPGVLRRLRPTYAFGRHRAYPPHAASGRGKCVERTQVVPTFTVVRSAG